MKYKIITIILISLLIIVATIILLSNNNTCEGFKNGPIDAKGFLTSSRDLYCENKGLAKSYGPQLCCINGKNCINTLNCRCVEPSNGLCKICHPRTKKVIGKEINKNA